MESWGRKRRSAEKIEKTEEDMTMSHEILVLDFGDEDTKFSNRQTASLPANFPNNSKTTEILMGHDIRIDCKICLLVQ
jgi:hypothetical protein